LYLENDHLDKSYNLIEYLLNSDYRLFWHISNMYNPKNYAGTADNIFPNAGAVKYALTAYSVSLPFRKP